jgi:putative membrane protein
MGLNIVGKTLAAATLLPATTGVALAQYGGRYGPGGGMMGPGGYGFWGMGWLNILIWVLILIGIIFLLRRLWPTTKPDDPAAVCGSRALDILKERYARGEIDRDQFESMKRDLED